VIDKAAFSASQDMKKSIALIFHENERSRAIRSFAIWQLAELWRTEGMEVRFLFGTRKYVPADLAMLHVDLSVVPREYIDFAHRYPVVLNGKLRDIRKSSISRNTVRLDDGYKGPVIVKSDLNYAGQPERKLLGTPWSRLAFRIACRLPLNCKRNTGPEPRFRSPADYTVFEDSRSVPREWFSRSDLLIEKFLPEMQDGLYCLRIYHFLGSRGVCILWNSHDPIVKAATVKRSQTVAAHPNIVALTRKMGFDYGKFDYVMRGDEPVLLDANKTPGAAHTAAFAAVSAEWAKGIRSYF
jgi:hypothetical protein